MWRSCICGARTGILYSSPKEISDEFHLWLVFVQAIRLNTCTRMYLLDTVSRWEHTNLNTTWIDYIFEQEKGEKSNREMVFTPCIKIRPDDRVLAENIWGYGDMKMRRRGQIENNSSQRGSFFLKKKEWSQERNKLKSSSMGLEKEKLTRAEKT